MPASYPTTPVIFPVRADGTPFYASFINDLQSEVAALEAGFVSSEGGTLPTPITVGGTRPAVVLDNALGTKGYLRAEPGYMILGQNLTKNAAGAPTQPNPGYPSTQWLVTNVGTDALIVNGSVAMADPPTITERLRVRSDGGIIERARSYAMGDWLNIPYSATYLAAASGTWTVPAGNFNYNYTVIGKLMVLTIYFLNTTITGTPNWLRVNLPGGISTTTPTYGMCAGYIPGTGWTECFYTCSGNNVVIYGGPTSGSLWAAGTAHVTISLSLWIA